MNDKNKTGQNPIELTQRIAEVGYICDPGLVASLHLMGVLRKPLLVEGEPGVGKTGVAHALAQAHDRELIRLQCYEGLDAQHALYDWNYQRQLLAIQMSASATTESANEISIDIYSDEYLLKRPLLQAITSAEPVVLLIDEVDRADEEFEALLLEILSDFQISIPEIGTYQPNSIPQVILTSNGTRELSDALRRRCLYHYIDYPDQEKELRIVQSRLPQADRQLAAQAVSFVQTLRCEPMRKTPGVAETLDWIASLLSLDVDNLVSSLEKINASLPALVKTHADRKQLQQTDEIERLLQLSITDADSDTQSGNLTS